MTTDAKAARSFYTSLFGWTVNEIPMGEQGTYYMFQKGGKTTAAMFQAGEQEKGIPPHWNNYVAVSSADSATDKIKSLGGKVLAGPFDVFDAGRMSMVMDPEGAAFAVWEGRRTKGVEVMNESGALCWNELYTPNIDASRKFYSSAFDWKLKLSPEYTEIHVGELPVGGMFAITKEMAGMPPNWMPYFAVDDADAAAKKIQSSSGRVHKEPTDIPNVGRFAVVADPQGASFAIIKVAM